MRRDETRREFFVGTVKLIPVVPRDVIRSQTLNRNARGSQLSHSQARHLTPLYAL